jgi:hypothetical protein
MCHLPQDLECLIRPALLGEQSGRFLCRILITVVGEFRQNRDSFAVAVVLNQSFG